ncbi:MAG: hypothetical protein ACKOOE_06445 [Micrococcales bacterium]
MASRLENCQFDRKPHATEKITTSAIQFSHFFIANLPLVSGIREDLGMSQNTPSALHKKPKLFAGHPYEFLDFSKSNDTQQ